MEQKIEKLMKNLNISREEAIQIIEDDNRIDKGENLFELTDEQKEVVKRATQADRVVTEKKPKRERKENADKQTLVNALAEAMNAIADDTCTITNKERELTFTFNEVKYKIVLSQPRS